MTGIPTGLYVHFPWCVQKCPYCDFNSHPVRGPIPEAAYVEQLLGDLRLEIAATNTPTLTSIFIGGGTPSLCSGPGIARLLAGIRNLVHVPADTEVTLEANPGTVDRVHFAQYRDAGVNRLSIGAQSFNRDRLVQLGRIHDAQDTQRAVETARRSGFTNINLDLMHGLPEQTATGACDDLTAAIALEPEHLSWYQLTIEPKTVFAERPPILPADPVLADIEARGLDLLEHHGYRRYEISAFAKHGRASIHNLNYWAFGDYLGIGAGAHGKTSRLSRARIERTEKPSQPRLYLKTDPDKLRSTRDVVENERPVEFMMNALRMIEGVDEGLYSARTGLPLSGIAPQLDALRQAELMRPDRLALTGVGLRYLDSVVGRFL